MGIYSYTPRDNTYAADGLRTSKTVNGQTTQYFWDDRGVMYKQANTGGNFLWFYADPDGTIGSINYNDARYALLKNAQGDVIGLADSSGSIVALYSYDSWGNIISITDGSGNDVSNNPTHIANINPIRYRGYYYDTETGLYYVSSRYYDPETCRFINADAFDIVQVQNDLHDKNLFAYCDNNPIMRQDHGGDRWGWKTFFGGIAVVAAVVAVGALTVASGGTAALAIAGAIGANAAAVSAAAATVGTYACAAGVAAGIGYGVTSVGSNYLFASNNNRGKQIGKEFRGGSKKQRDKWYGNNDKNFQKWFERRGKRYYNDGLDIGSRSEMEELYDIWKELGKPRVK